MSKQVQIRRGAIADIPTLAEGEFGFSTDTNQLYIGTSTGNIQFLPDLSGTFANIPTLKAGQLYLATDIGGMKVGDGTENIDLFVSDQVKHVLPGQTLKDVVATITDASSSKIYTVYIHPNTTIGTSYVHPNSYIRLKAVERQVWDNLDFGNADFSTGIRFNDMQFGSANFSLANMSNCWFTQCSFSTPNFQIGNTAFLTGTIFYNCDFAGGNFTGAKLYGTEFVACNRTQPSVSLNFTNTTNWTYTNWVDSTVLSNSILTGSPVTTLTLFKARSNIKYNALTLYQDGVPILGFRNHGSVASASTVTIPSEGYAFITGTTNITSITALSAGARLILNFEGALTVTDGLNLKLNGNYVTTADDTLQLVSNGTNWYETARSAN